jgi:hypothetical protein
MLFQLPHQDPHASSRHVNERQEFASMRIVHMQAIAATMSRHDIPAPAQFRFRSVRSNAGGCCCGSGCSDVERLRDGPGEAAGGFTPSCAPRDVASATFQRAYVPKAAGRRWPLGIAALEDKSVPTDSGNSPWRDLGRGLSGILVRVPAGAKPARCAGCAMGRDYEEEGDLGARRGHS